jgi:hypothetical protein
MFELKQHFVLLVIIHGPISVQPNLSRSFGVSVRARSSLLADAYGTPYLLLLCNFASAVAPAPQGTANVISHHEESNAQAMTEAIKRAIEEDRLPTAKQNCAA